MAARRDEAIVLLLVVLLGYSTKRQLYELRVWKRQRENKSRGRVRFKIQEAERFQNPRRGAVRYSYLAAVK
jgi:hypothetical protein